MKKLLATLAACCGTAILIYQVHVAVLFSRPEVIRKTLTPGTGARMQIIKNQLESPGDTTITDDFAGYGEGKSRVAEEGEDEDEEMENERLRDSPYILHEDEEAILMSKPPKMSKVKVLSEWRLQTQYRKSFSKCRYSQCRWDRNNSQADAVLFKASSVRTWNIRPFPRKPGQRWVFYTVDPAIKNYNLDRADVRSQFNATSTYQLRSDYPRIFGRLQKVQPPEKNYGKIFEGKHRQAAWFVSHCETWSKREVYIERMRKIIPVDVFGDCGKLTCGQSTRRTVYDGNVCLPMLSEKYKFYLSFENSYCQDYVTEKFFKLFQDVDVIPVVQGAFDYKKYLPSNVYIDSADFKSPEELAIYLIELGEDKNRYINMLQRKSRWRFRSGEQLHCVVCEKLHTQKNTHFYPDMVAAFNGRPSDCYQPTWLDSKDLV